MDDKKVSMIVCKTPAQGYNKEGWSEMTNWLVEHYRTMDATFSDPVKALAARMNLEGDD
ncbi:hypothetical protein [Primorskyibacter flagellatus]|uniref:hypothetical protein n=1 Tax=Primorskyibacter flagellatus TaxID=1387277 RepID=UPI003A932E13